MRVIAIVLSILLWASNVFSWTAPVGIPDPSWPSDLDIARPTLPSPWNSNTAGFYYIKNGGTNVGNGYPADPKDSIPAGSLSAGDVVVIEVGTAYPDSENISDTGTSGSPIWIMSSVDGTQVVCSGDWGFTGSYLIFDDLDFDSGSRESSLPFSGSYILMRDAGVTYTHDTTSGSGFSVSSGADHIVIYSSDIGPLGNWQYTGGSDIDQHGIKFNQSAEYVWVVDNNFHEIEGDAIQVGDQGYAASLVNHIYIAGNTATNCNQTGFWVKSAEDVIIAHNDVSGMGYYTSGGGGGAGLGGQYTGTRTWFLYNVVHDCARGIDLHEKTLSYALQNVFYDIWGEPSDCNQWNYGGIHFRVTGTYYALHNTIYNSINFQTPSGSGTKYYRNNIYSSPATRTYSCPRIDTDTSPNVGHTDYNLYDSDSLDIDWEEGPTYTSLAAFASAQSEETHRTIGNPQFTNAAGHDFSIGATSDAIDSSNDESAIYDAYASTYGESIYFDIAGTARPATVTDWDIGAYEYAAAGDTTPPTVDTFTIPASSNSLTVSISSFTASDAVGVTGYCVNESATPPTAGSCSGSGWEGTAQTSYVFSTPGTKTLYPWAKDAAGNISDSASQYDQVNIIFKGVYGAATFSNATIR